MLSLTKTSAIISLRFICLTYLFNSALASWADQHSFFKSCVLNCEEKEVCLKSLEARSEVVKGVDAAFGWSCADECKQLCMWSMTANYVKTQNLVPKFYGRWPLIRYFGMLEPASSIASFATLITSVCGFWYLKRHLYPNSPFVKYYNIIFALNCFTWISSTLFHIRDWFIFERMDYYGAFLTVFVPLMWFICRNCVLNYPPLFTVASTMVAVCFIADVVYMELVKFDHTFHLTMCTAIVALGFALWFIWIVKNFYTVPVARYYLLTHLLLAVGPLTAKYFEWNPPFRWIYDAHSIFHILTIPSPLLFWWTLTKDDVFMNTQAKQKSL